MTTSRSAADTRALAAQLAATITPGTVLALTGDLGTGKTHFVQGLAAALGYPGPVTSPTFTLIHEYPGGRLPLAHIDLYRLDTAEEALRIGLDETLDSGGITAIEWADKFPELIPADAIWIHLRHTANDTREIEIVCP